MATSSLTSHAAASRVPWLLVPSDVLHLVSTGSWVGGLLFLVIAVPVVMRVLVPGSGARTQLLALLLSHFAPVALISVALLVVTGTLQSIFQLGLWENLLGSSYGRALVIKIAVFGATLALGAYHFLSLAPRLRRYAQSTSSDDGAGSLQAGHWQRFFFRSVRLEMILGALILLVVGGLTSLSPPPHLTSGSPSTPLLVRQGQAGDLTYRIVVSPGHIGVNRFEIELKQGATGQPLTGAGRVLLQFTMEEMDMGVQQVPLEPVAGRPGFYTTTESVLSMAGTWHMRLLVRRDGFDDVRVEETLVMTA
jgi:copper transport protein